MSKNFFLTLFIFACFSCHSDFLNTHPTDAYDETFVFSTTEKAYAAINGIHRTMVIQYASNLYYGGYPSIMMLNDMLGEDVVLTSNANQYWLAEYQWQGHRSAVGIFPFFAYHLFYKLIANANMIIENIDRATGPETEKQMIKGQALAYRGFSYFWLVQLYGKRYVAGEKNEQPGIPLMLSSNAGKQARANVADVYIQIIQDLKEAEQYLEETASTFSRPVKNHFNTAIVEGLLARVYLTMQDWENAKTYAQKAISHSGCKLMNEKEYLSGFNKASNPEWLWAFEQSPDQSVYYHGFMSFMSCNFGSSNIRNNPKAISSRLYDQIPEGDIRKKLWDPTGQLALPETFIRYPYMNCKFKVADPSSSVADICFMRLAELYLILAEAKAHLNEKDATDVLYSLVHSRYPDYQKSTAEGEALLDEILFQRRIELWGEGFRFTDLKRLNISLDRTQSNHKENLCRILYIPIESNEWEFMLPQKEINANELITQNPS